MKLNSSMHRVLAFIFTFFSFFSIGQVKISIGNKSFEDIPRKGGELNRMPISGWFDCGELRFPTESPPDVHPGGFWENTTPASNGNTYIGMVVRDNETYEGISQKLSQALKVGYCYKFTIDLAKSPKYMSKSRVTNKDQNYDRPTVLRIWGGSGLCHEMQLLGESGAIDHLDWRTYQFKVVPTFAHKFIMIEAYYKTPVISPYCGHILIDNLSDFEELACDVVLSPVLKKQSIAEKAENKPLPPHKKTRVDQAKEQGKAEAPIVANKQKILQDLDIKKIKLGTTIEIKNLYFKADTSTIDKSSYEVLEEIYNFLKSNDGVTVEIGGHTNGIPTHTYCDKLSSQRALAVRDYLIGKGIKPDRITSKGYGKRRRIASDATVDGRNKNQRVEIKILSIG